MLFFIKKMIQEAADWHFWQAKKLDLDGYDIIFIARNTIDNKKCRDVEKSMLSALKRTAIIKGKQ